MPKQPHIAFLYNLYVDPTARQQGTALHLWHHIISQLKQHAPEIERVFLFCVAANKPAISFYKKCGFSDVEFAPRVLNGITNILMR